MCLDIRRVYLFDPSGIQDLPDFAQLVIRFGPNTEVDHRLYLDQGIVLIPYLAILVNYPPLKWWASEAVYLPQGSFRAV